MHSAWRVGIRKDVVARVAVDAVAGDLPVDLRPARQGVIQALQRVQAAPLGHDDAVARLVERPRRPPGIRMRGKRPLRLEAGEDPEGVDALAHAPADRQVHLAQPQHLRRVDEAQVACRAGRPDRVGGTGDAQVQGNLAGGVVGHRARIVVVRPELGVVAELRDGVDLVLGLHVSVLGAPDVDSHPVLGARRKVQAAVGERLPRAIDADAPRPRANPQLLLLLIPKRIEMADARRKPAHVPHLDPLDPGDSVEQVRSKLRQRIPIRSGETHPGDDDAR